LKEIGGQPAIGYLFYRPSTGLYEVRYAQYNGTRWRIMTVGQGSSTGPSLAEINDQPALGYVYYDPSAITYEVRYAVFEGTDWQIETVDTGYSYAASLAEVDGQPAISYGAFDPETGEQTRYAEYNGTAWQVESVDVGSGYGPSLAEIGSQPGISYLYTLTDSSGYELRYAQEVEVGDGGFTYTPPEDFSGVVTFTYQATDGNELSNVATVTINVEALPTAITLSTLATRQTPPLAFGIGGAVALATASIVASLAWQRRASHR
jgi:hypothetical protein